MLLVRMPRILFEFLLLDFEIMSLILSVDVALRIIVQNLRHFSFVLDFEIDDSLMIHLKKNR